MNLLLTFILLVALLAPLGIAIRRSTELFVLRIGHGTKLSGHPSPPLISRVEFVRGRIPPALLRDLREVLETSGTEGTLRVVIERGKAVLTVRGTFSEETLQRVRNLVGLFPVAKLRAGAPPRRTWQ